MPAGSRKVVLVLLQVAAVAVHCYHKPQSDPSLEIHCWPLEADEHNTDTTDCRVHCWPLDADEYNTDIIDCRGLDLVWNFFPPLFVLQGDTVTLSANITADDSFFDTDSGSGSGAEFCQKECASDCSNVTSPDDCCVWHANVHVCFPISDLCGTEVLCGPWITNTFITYQTPSQCGPLGTFTDQVVLTVPGLNTVIYHMQVGDLQIVLGTYIFVEPDSCGDGTCQRRVEVCETCPEREDGLDGTVCVICPEDCCPLSFAVILGTFFGTILFIVVTITLIITLSICVCVQYRKKKRMKDNSWIINYSDILISCGKKAMSSLSSLNKKKDNSSGVYSSLQDLQALQIFTEIGTYKGRAVAIRRVRRPSSVTNTIPSKLRKEVVQIRTLEHQNLCKFIGATVKDNTPNVAIISEYCSKGSLNDVLLNDNVPLNWNFRFSFAGDIARGMAYLHSHGIVHGRLTSSNCVIDDRWVTKVTDYGLPGLRHQVVLEGGESEQYQGNIPKVYRAPEVRDVPLDKPSTSTSADVYSYAIILFEIATRMDPRSEDMLQLDTNWKPRISQKDLTESECPCPQDYLHLINKCWTFSPQTRHTFDKIKKQLREINPSTTSAIDNMMLMMEKYSKHLEQLVEERTAELELEKQRATDLLYRMIPQAVADELKHGKTVGAETFSGATIFFSDIVGFTNLAGSSEPMEIVGLLNKLYTEFDDVVDQFDVYKVETIGDAYMVVSGVPRLNGDNHAGEIAKMALGLMGRCKTFTIPHRPDTTLQIRAGIHSGSVCAGIVGVKMPRYCLFGDTVNIASRMESNSIAMHIQCSSTTHDLLNKLGGFTLEERGVIEVKGKGEMKTWWLVDYTEPDIVVLPPAREDAPTSPTTMEPIREPPKKYSVGIVSERSSDLRCSGSSVSLSKGDSLNSTGLDLYKKHQILHSSSFNNLLTAEGGGERGAGEKVAPKRSITMPRESSKNGSITELPQPKTSLTSMTRTGPTGVRYSVPHITVNTFPSGGRRVTQPNTESVGLAAGRELQSRTSTASKDHIPLAVTPLDNKHSTEL